MSDDPILAAIQATRFADAVMGRTAALDQPHHDWQPLYKGRPVPGEKWHPPYGESHVKYHVWRAGGGNNPIVWTATHHGLATGPTTFKSPLGLDDRDYTRTVYEHEDDPERIGRFRTPQDARAAAEHHYLENYPQPRHKYDLSHLDAPTPPPAGRGMGDDEDYSRIFDAVRRALKKAGSALRRTAAHEHVESGQRGRPDWTGCAHPECRPDLPTTMYHVSHPRNRDSIAQHGLLASYSEDDDFSDGLGMPHGIYLTADEPKPSHDTEQWPGDVWAVDTTKLKHLENDFPGGLMFRNAYATKYDVPPEAMRLHRPSAHHRLGGLHARLAATVHPVNPGVMGRIAAELSPPCPDCGQVAGFDEHMVSPRIRVCRNCEYPMTDIGHDHLLERTLGDHARAVSDLPETDHPTLGKHGQLSYEDTMKLIDEQLAAGEPREDGAHPRYVRVDRNYQPTEGKCAWCDADISKTQHHTWADSNGAWHCPQMSTEGPTDRFHEPADPEYRGNLNGYSWHSDIYPPTDER